MFGSYQEMYMNIDNIDLLINKRLEIGSINKGNIPTDILAKFYLGAVASVGLEWLIGNNKYSKQDILNYLEELIPNNIIHQ